VASSGMILIPIVKIHQY